MGLQTEGYVTTRYVDFVDEIEKSFETNLPFLPVFDDQDPLTHIVNIMATLCARFDEEIYGVWVSQDIETAEGTSLDREVRKLNIFRNPAAYTTGDVVVVTDDNITVAAGGLQVSSSNSGVLFENQSVVTTTQTSCYAASYTPVITDGTYSITINGVVYNFTSSNTNPQVIVDGLITQYNLSPITNVIVEALIDPIRIRIQYDDTVTNSLSFTNPLQLEVYRVETSFVYTAQTTGVIYGPADTLTVIETPISGVYSTYNPVALGVGRDIETDEELRARAIDFAFISGSATVESIRAAVLNVEGVTACTIINNPLQTIDENGVPGNSVHVIVTGASDADTNIQIANAIFSKLPAGTNTYGGDSPITIDVTANDGVITSISFSHPETVYIAVKVAYNLYDEESFLTSTQTDMANAISEYVNGLGSGADVLSGRLVAQVADTTTGVDIQDIYMRVIPSTVWAKTRISVQEGYSAYVSPSDIYFEQGS